MAEYIVTQVREVVVEAKSAAESLEKAKAVYYARPGFDRELHRSIQEVSLKSEKRR